METGPDSGSHRRVRRSGGLGRALLLTAASTIVPGTAHLSKGRKIAGSLLLAAFLALVGVVVWAATRSGQALIGIALQPGWLLGITIGLVVLALAWSATVVWSYRTVRPTGLGASNKIIAGFTVGVLCLVICAPLGVAATFAHQSRGLLNTVFPDSTVSAAPGDDPWTPHERLNVLLIGGDAAPSRPGVRTDVMILASVDTTTGRTVLLSIPRNMRHTPMPFPKMRQRFPGGFPKFLYGLWRYGVMHPKLVPGQEKPGSQEAGAHLLTATIEKILGVPVDYYALMDLDGFKAMVNALGGVRINVQHPIPYGPHAQHTVAPGNRVLNGNDALWYARSRTGSSDYDRMRRQRCMLGALTDQADPATVLANFRRLATATKRAVSTSIPRALLPHLVKLAPKIKQAKITNVQLVPPLINTGDPNFKKVRRIAQQAIADAERHADGKRNDSGGRGGNGGNGGKSHQATPSPHKHVRAHGPVHAPPPGTTDSHKQHKPDKKHGKKHGKQGSHGKQGRDGPGHQGKSSAEVTPVSLAAACPGHP